MSNYWSGVLSSRVSRRRALSAGGGLALSSALLAACGGSDGDTGGETNNDTSGLLAKAIDESNQAQRGGTNRFFLNADQQNLDPTFTSLPNQAVTNQVYGQFWHYVGGRMKPSDGTLAGDVAESWEYSGDKLTLTIKLSDKAHFGTTPVVAGANGRSPDAQDVIYSWDRFRSQGTRRSDIVNEINPEAPVISMTAIDAKTVQIKMAVPYGIFDHLMTNTQAGNMFILPKEAANDSVLNLRQTQLGTGPWQLDRYEPSIQMVYKRNPGFQQDRRGLGVLPYMDEHVIAIVPEYAAQLAQFKDAKIYFMPVRAEDQIVTKRDVPALEMVATDLQSASGRWFFGMQPGSPGRDDRFRQAWQMAVDRDFAINVLFNVDGFAKEGLPMEWTWDTGLPNTAWEGWWIDPKGADWAPNYKFNLAESKKLLSAMGFGGEVNMRYPATGYPDNYYKAIEVVLAMVQEAGIRTKISTVNFNTEWRPQLADARGNFEGVSVIVDSGGSEPANFLYLHYNSKGSLNHGYDPDNPVGARGDATLNDLTSKARLEFDVNKRKALVHDIQKYEAKKVWFPRTAGGSNGFSLAWPAYRGRQVWQGTGSRGLDSIWLDRNKAPFKT